jgi:hypothetical protein
MSLTTRHQVEKISQHPHAQGLGPLHAILRVICPCDVVESAEASRGDSSAQSVGAHSVAVDSCVRARDCSSSVYNAQLSLSNSLRYSTLANSLRPGSCIRSLGYSVMNEQLINLCDVSARLNSAAELARQVFGHVPAISGDPVSAVWKLLSLCCLPPHERVAALAPCASIFSLLDLLRCRLDCSKLFCG